MEVGQLAKSTYKISKINEERHERNLGHILYLIRENYGIHRNLLKKLASKKGPNHMAPVTAERMIDELLKDGRISARKSDKMRYYTRDDWYTEEQLQSEFSKVVTQTEEIIKKIKSKFPAFNYEGKQGIIRELEFGFGRIFPIPLYYEAVLKPSESEEDKCMRMIRYYSKNTTKESVAKLYAEAKARFKEIKMLKKEITIIRKKMRTKTSNNPRQYQEQYILLNQLSMKNTNFYKSMRILYDILSSIQNERRVRFQNY